MSKIIFPNYHNSILQIIGSIKKYYQEDFKYGSSKELDEILESKRINHIVFMILDGLGSKIIDNNLKSDDLLAKNKIKDLISIYPSTTAAATTTALSGLAPIESGWTGWENYIKEIDRNIVLFTGKDYFTGEETGVNGNTYLPYDFFWKDFNGFTSMIMPPFHPMGVESFKKALKKLRKNIKEHKKSFHYVYWTEPDAVMHEYGSKSKESKIVIEDLNKKVENLYKHISEDTLVIISADHGHIDVSSIDLTMDEKLFSMLKRKPANDSRGMAFTVKEEYMCEFKDYFNFKYGEFYMLYETAEAISKGFFGDINISYINPRIKDFLGDYFAVGIKDKYFIYTIKDFEFKSHHAGMTEEEMLVPLIVLNKQK